MPVDFCARLDRALDGYMEENRFSGLLRVTREDRILYERCVGFEDPDTRVPITARSRFTLYSLSKPFCALGLMKLAERGLVSLDAHPARYVPEAAGFDSRVTVSHMLHHVSGMPDFNVHENYALFCDPDTELDVREVVKELAALPMRFVPGTSAQYANINFVLLALIAENVSGMPYGEYMKKEVFDPLGAEHAVVDRPGLEIEHRVTGLSAADDGVLLPARCNIRWLFGAGDVNGDADDVYSLNRAVKHGLLLSPESWKEVLTPSPVSGFGCGCSVSLWHGKTRIKHNGGHIGFRTLHIQLPEDDFDLILLSNCDSPDARDSLSEAAYEAYYGTGDAG